MNKVNKPLEAGKSKKIDSPLNAPERKAILLNEKNKKKEYPLSSSMAGPGTWHCPQSEKGRMK